MSKLHPLRITTAQTTCTLFPAGPDRTKPLSELLRQTKLPLNTRCGGRGLCDGCMVELVSGEVVESQTGAVVRCEGQPRLIRGCTHHPGDAGAHLRIIPRSSLHYEPSVVSDYRINVSYSHEPLWERLTVHAVDGKTRTAQQLCQRVQIQRPEAPVRVAESLLPQWQAIEAGGQCVATVEYRGDHRLITALDMVAAPNGGSRALGAAIDIGTTTVALLLADLSDGRVVGRAAAFNEQMRLGDDVLTRINLCGSDASMLGQLQKAVADQTIEPLLDAALRQSGAAPADIKCMSISGNTTMLHLLAGVDPTPMGQVPFTPAFLGHMVHPGKALFHRRFGGATCHLLPGASAYVGADLTAGIVASGMLYEDGPSLLVDVGTNGEIILKIGSMILGCATAAGPAFEGARLSSGMRAGVGAISHIRLGAGAATIEIETIGSASQAAKDAYAANPGVVPVGICGSAYVDFLAEGRASGLLMAAGRFNPKLVATAEGRTDGDNAAPGIVRLPDGPNNLAFRLAWGQGHQPIVVSQADVARLLEAKAAIGAGIITLLAQAGLRQADVKTLYLAGGFGTHMSSRSAIASGMLPGFTPEQIQPVGNTALAGAYLALMDAGLMADMQRAGKEMRVIELNRDPEFEGRYIDQLMLPEGNRT